MAAANKMVAPVSYTTPVNRITREALAVLITNNVMNNSLEFASDCDMMETDSPLRKPDLFLVSKKLFHSPLNEDYSEDRPVPFHASQKNRKAKKRKQVHLQDSSEKMKKVYIIECDKDGDGDGMRKKVLLSLFHDKEYFMESDG
ncbi:hypothetical protein evm_009347 [Chilo suppressalis]|nr:hypothetical protein evm_009347 [Chilo suppressalis]